MACHAEQRIIGTISLMQRYILSPQAQEKACKDLAVLCRLHHEENGSYAIRQGVMSHILAALQAYPGSSGIQQAATAVLRHLAGPSHSMEMCVALQRAPVLLRTLEAMGHQPWGTELRHVARSICHAYERGGLKTKKAEPAGAPPASRFQLDPALVHKAI